MLYSLLGRYYWSDSAKRKLLVFLDLEVGDPVYCTEHILVLFVFQTELNNCENFEFNHIFVFWNVFKLNQQKQIENEDWLCSVLDSSTSKAATV